MVPDAPLAAARLGRRTVSKHSSAQRDGKQAAASRPAARMANAPRPASAVAKPNQAGWHTFPSGRTAWIDKFGRPDDIITLTRPAAKYLEAEEEEITYERLMDRTKNQRRKELGDKQLNAIISSTGVDWNRHKCKRRSQAELLLKLGTEDVVRKRTDQEERTKRAIRRIDAGRLARVTTLGREDKDRMLQAPSSPRHRLRREVSAPTLLALMGDDALTMQPEAWAAKLKAQRLAPKAAMWCAPPALLTHVAPLLPAVPPPPPTRHRSPPRQRRSMKDPGYGAEGPSGTSLLISDQMRKEGIGLRKPASLVRKGSAGSNQATVPPPSEAEGGGARAVASAQELGGEGSRPASREPPPRLERPVTAPAVKRPSSSGAEVGAGEGRASTPQAAPSWLKRLSVDEHGKGFGRAPCRVPSTWIPQLSTSQGHLRFMA